MIGALVLISMLVAATALLDSDATEFTTHSFVVGVNSKCSGVRHTHSHTGVGVGACVKLEVCEGRWVTVIY